MKIKIRDMGPEDEDFVSMCGHSFKEMKENPVFIKDIHNFCDQRIKWFKEKYAQGFRAKVALYDNVQAGFLYIVPIEICPWGPIGTDLLVIPCLNVNADFKEKGIGKALLNDAEKEIELQGKKGIVVSAFRWKEDFWFMPVSYFEKHGFITIKSKKHPSGSFEEFLLWKTIDDSAEIPEFFTRNYKYKPIQGKVVVDLFFNTFCETSNTEANRVREVVDEFNDKVVLHEYSADDRIQLLKHQISRAIYVNGKQYYWGYEAPREGIRDAIKNAMK